MTLLEQTSETIVYEPGLVHIKGALSLEAQADLARRILECGEDKEYGFWEETDAEDDGSRRRLNSTLTRGRIYKAISQHNKEFSELLLDLGRMAHARACALDSAMPPPVNDPTHAFLLYYAANSKRLGEHRDNGRNDGSGDQPVISFNIGKAIDFTVRHEKTEEKQVIRMESGDVLLFGGPSRSILHGVKKIHKGTSPLAPFGIPDDIRLNLTIRHSPEILGREEEFRYFRPWIDKSKK